MASSAPPPPLRVLARPLTAFAFAAVLTYGSMFELALRSGAPAGLYGGTFGLVLHWLHHGTLMLPLVLAAVWPVLALVPRLTAPARLSVPLAAGGAALAGAVAFAFARAATAPLLAGRAHHGVASNPRLVDDLIVALVVGLAVAGLAAAVVVASTPRQRRHFRLAAAVATAAILAGAAAWQAHADIQGGSLLRDVVSPCFNDSPVAPPFTARFTVPARLTETDNYVISEERGVAQIIPGINTPIWGYRAAGMPNATVPGPTIVARKGEGRPVNVTFVNNLPPNDDPGSIIMKSPLSEEHPFVPSSTSVHLHGINADHFADGYPDDDGAGAHNHRRGPGEAFTHHYPNNEYQRPATLWYHDHSVHITSTALFRGLAAFYIVQDKAEDASRLPGTLTGDPGRHGVADGTTDLYAQRHFDIPLMVRDTMIDPETGLLFYDNCSHMGAFGDVMTVNGKQQPRFEVANRKYRFRLLNASDSRQYLVALRTLPNLTRDAADESANEPFFLIGTDQGLLRSPLVTKRFHTIISKRHELVIDFSRYPIGTKLVLVNLLADPDDRKVFPLMQFHVKRAEVDTSDVPAVLRPDANPTTAQPDEHPADQQEPSKTRVFQFSRSNGPYWSINGQIFDPLRDDARPTLNSTEDWILVNDSGGWGHPIHLHLGRFKVMKAEDIQGRAPLPGELEGWQDVIWVGPNQRIKVRHQFWNFTGRFVFHCHNLSHEDFDMMSQWNVQPSAGSPTPPDTVPPTVSMVAPVSGAKLAGTVALAAVASDNLLVGGVTFSLDGAPLRAQDTTAPYGVTWDTTTVANGPHWLSAIVRDAAGNENISAPVRVTVDNSALLPLRFLARAGRAAARGVFNVQPGSSGTVGGLP